jgi:uncharacterized membrane protein
MSGDVICVQIAEPEPTTATAIAPAAAVDVTDDAPAALSIDDTSIDVSIAPTSAANQQQQQQQQQHGAALSDGDANLDAAARGAQPGDGFDLDRMVLQSHKRLRQRTASSSNSGSSTEDDEAKQGVESAATAAAASTASTSSGTTMADNVCVPLCTVYAAYIISSQRSIVAVHYHAVRPSMRCVTRSLVMLLTVILQCSVILVAVCVAVASLASRLISGSAPRCTLISA